MPRIVLKLSKRPRPSPISALNADPLPIQPPKPADSPTSSMDQYVRNEIVRLEQACFQAVATDNMDQLRDEWDRTLERILRSADQDLLNHKTLSLVRDVVLRVQIIASGLAANELAIATVQAEALQRVHQQLSSSETETKSSPPPKDSSVAKPSLQKPRHPSSRPTHSINGALLPTPRSTAPDPSLTPLRDWFLTNITYPYLDHESTPYLNSLCPSLTAPQLRTWFINARRRSGWSEVYKTYGKSCKDGMVALLGAIDSPLENWQVSKKAKEDVEKVRRFFTDERFESEVSEGVKRVVEGVKRVEGKSPRKVKKPKAVVEEAQTTVATTEGQRNVSLADSTSSSSSTYSINDYVNFDFDSSPPRPSPSSSSRNVSDSSATSFESTFSSTSAPIGGSYGQAFSTPYYSTVADGPYATMNPILMQQRSHWT